MVLESARRAGVALIGIVPNAVEHRTRHEAEVLGELRTRHEAEGLGEIPRRVVLRDAAAFDRLAQEVTGAQAP